MKQTPGMGRLLINTFVNFQLTEAQDQGTSSVQRDGKNGRTLRQVWLNQMT